MPPGWAPPASPYLEKDRHRRSGWFKPDDHRSREFDLLAFDEDAEIPGKALADLSDVIRDRKIAKLEEQVIKLLAEQDRRIGHVSNGTPGITWKDFDK